MPPALFTLVIFQTGSHFCAWTDLDCDPAIYTFLIDKMIGMYHYTQPLVEMGFHKLLAQAGLKL
jgi:hypothetical protein